MVACISQEWWPIQQARACKVALPFGKACTFALAHDEAVMGHIEDALPFCLLLHRRTGALNALPYLPPAIIIQLTSMLSPKRTRTSQAHQAQERGLQVVFDCHDTTAGAKPAEEGQSCNKHSMLHSRFL